MHHHVTTGSVAILAASLLACAPAAIPTPLNNDASAGILAENTKSASGQWPHLPVRILSGDGNQNS